MSELREFFVMEYSGGLWIHRESPAKRRLVWDLSQHELMTNLICAYLNRVGKNG